VFQASSFLERLFSCVQDFDWIINDDDAVDGRQPKLVVLVY